jgi:hypothetical protein
MSSWQQASYEEEFSLDPTLKISKALLQLKQGRDIPKKHIC